MMASIDLSNGSARRAFEHTTHAVTGRTSHRIIPSVTNGLNEELYRRLWREFGYTFAVPLQNPFSAATLAEVRKGFSV